MLTYLLIGFYWTIISSIPRAYKVGWDDGRIVLTILFNMLFWPISLFNAFKKLGTW